MFTHKHTQRKQEVMFCLTETNAYAPPPPSPWSQCQPLIFQISNVIFFFAEITSVCNPDSAKSGVVQRNPRLWHLSGRSEAGTTTDTLQPYRIRQLLVSYHGLVYQFITCLYHKQTTHLGPPTQNMSYKVYIFYRLAKVKRHWWGCGDYVWSLYC